MLDAAQSERDVLSEFLMDSPAETPAWFSADFDFASSPESMIPATPSSGGWSPALIEDLGYPVDPGDREQDEEMLSSSALTMQPMDNPSFYSLAFEHDHPYPTQWD